MKLSSLFLQARDISVKNKQLWVMSAAPTAFLVIGGVIFITAFYLPLVRVYSMFNSTDPDIIVALRPMVEDQLKRSIGYLFPVLLVFLGITILCKNAVIKSVEHIMEGKKIVMRNAWDESRGYFAPTVLLILCIASISLTAHIIETYLQHVTESQSILTIVSLVLEVTIVFASLFSLHYVLIRHDPALVAFKKSFVFTAKHFFHLLSFFLILLVLSLLVMMLMGAVAGISYYVSLIAGVIVGLALMLVLIPVNVFLTTLWTLFFISLSKESTS